ncbi:AraC family transcriptional regulator [Promicromonospora panici]|uniref:AraC family transcriptional regulator n=1 Tax=Promicromonospora panici TaxID=2219658 RepID=UPI00101CA6B7|nr:AraC family transcriptional regulator [Promicromonospora panici]
MIDTVLDNAHVAIADRFAHLRELMSRVAVPMEISATDHTELMLFQRDLHLGEVRMWSMKFQPLAFHRTAQLVRWADPETYNICVPQNGEMTYAADRREVTYGPGELLVHDSSRPFGLRGSSVSGPVTCVGIEIPKAAVGLPRDRADQVAGLRIPGREGMGALLATVLTHLTANSDLYQPAHAPRLAAVASGLVSALFSQVLDDGTSTRRPESHRQTLTLQIRAYIREHLNDPELTREAIAAAHHISTRYLHRLFQEDGTGVMAWIRQQRLEHARRDLADPEWNAVPIHQIAARWGFTHHADFTRAFGNAHGVPPSEYRRLAQTGAR